MVRGESVLELDGFVCLAASADGNFFRQESISKINEANDSIEPLARAKTCQFLRKLVRPRQSRSRVPARFDSVQRLPQHAGGVLGGSSAGSAASGWAAIRFFELLRHTRE